MQPRASQRFAAVLTGSVVVWFAQPANAQPSRVSGVFSNVWEHPESGDLLGTEVEIHPDAPKPYAFVTVCEGWCNLFYRVPGKISGDRIELGFTEAYVGAAGAPADPVKYRLTGRVTGRTLAVRLQSGSYSEFEQLKHRTNRFGLAVAHPATQQ